MRIATGLWVAVVGAVFALPGHAGVRKCTDASGRVVYQDAHCPQAAAPVAAPPAAPVAARPSDRVRQEGARREAQPAHGAWRGAAQFRYLSGAPQDASIDADLQIDLMPDGRLQGGAIGAGCRLEGVFAAQPGASAVAVDITISACRDVRFNARYAGQLDPARSRLRLHAITAASPVTADGYRELSMATVDAALRR